MSSLSLVVSNIKCNGCVSNIVSGLATLEGVDNVSVDIATGTVQITGTNLDKSSITTKLSELGYPEKQL